MMISINSRVGIFVWDMLLSNLCSRKDIINVPFNNNIKITHCITHNIQPLIINNINRISNVFDFKPHKLFNHNSLQQYKDNL
jgi:hypothetical protein